MVELTNMMIGSLDDVGGENAGQMAAMEVYALCDQMAAARRADPRDDIMTALVNAEVDGEHLDDGELNMFFVTLIVAGNETTREPDQPRDARVHRQPGRGRAVASRRIAVADCGGGDAPLRHVDPQLPPYRDDRHRAARRADQGRRQGGHVLRGGQRDEEVFADPHRFDVSRKPNDHVNFGGGGVHFCLGASLAKAQIRATMREVGHSAR